MISPTIAALFLDGDYDDARFCLSLVAGADLILAADGGARVLLELGVRPDAVVGDFDSLDEAAVRRLEADGVELIRHPTHKDMTDGELVVEEALRRKAGELILAGGTGALDHTLGHIAILRRLTARGVPARLAAPRLSVRVLVAPTRVVLGAGAGTRVSLAPLGNDALVSLDGFEYPLDRGLLPGDACLGLGNHVVDPGAATVTLHEGAVVVLVEDGDERFVAGDSGDRGPSASGSPGVTR